MLDREKWQRIQILTKKWRRRWREWRIVKKRMTQVGTDCRALFKPYLGYGSISFKLALHCNLQS